MTVREAEPVVREWLAVLARCFQLQDAVAVLELDRVRDVWPEELNAHRRGLREARRDRQELVLRCTNPLVTRMNAPAWAANAKVLLHPAKSPAVVGASNQVVAGVHEFQERVADRQAVGTPRRGGGWRPPCRPGTGRSKRGRRVWRPR
ncbi:hypothetical protein ACW23B_16825 [Streptomyces albidoflavus]